MRGIRSCVTLPLRSSALFTCTASIHHRRTPTLTLPPTVSLQHSCCHCSNGVSNKGKDSHAKDKDDANPAEAPPNLFAGGRLIQSLQHKQPPRGSGIQPLLDYNRRWATKVVELEPDYFKTLAEAQYPQYLWIGCSDSRVPANEVVGLVPGDVFVHRNIANIVSNADLNVLSVLHYAIECLGVEHVIVAGHYKCGGVKASLEGVRVGLADHWILHVSSVKRRFWKRMQSDIAPKFHLDALCELNVITQLANVVDTHLMQQAWASGSSDSGGKESLELHGWIYGLDDGMLRPLLSLNRNTDLPKAIAAAEEAVFMRYGLH